MQQRRRPGVHRRRRRSARPGQPRRRRPLEVNAPLHGRRQQRPPARPRLRPGGDRHATATATSPSPARWSSCRRTRNFLSDGVIKAPDARPERLAFEGVFLPTAARGRRLGHGLGLPGRPEPAAAGERLDRPAEGRDREPENVYTLDKTGLTQLTKANGDPCRAGLAGGHRYELPDGKGSITLRRLEALDQAAGLEHPRRLAGARLGDAGRPRHGRLADREAAPPLRPGRSRPLIGRESESPVDRRPQRGSRAHGRGGSTRSRSPASTAWTDAAVSPTRWRRWRPPAGWATTLADTGDEEESVIAYYSSLAMVTSAVLYLLAMTVHAAEWASARAREGRPSPALAGSGAVPERRRRPPASVADAPPAPSAADRAARPDRAWPSRSSRRSPTSPGSCCAGSRPNRAPWGNMYEFITTVAGDRGDRLPGAGRPFAACAGSACRSPCCSPIGQGLAVTVFYVAVSD